MIIIAIIIGFFIMRSVFQTPQKPQLNEIWDIMIRKNNFDREFQQLIHLFFKKDLINPAVFFNNFEYVSDSLDIFFSTRELNKKTYKTSPTVTIFQDFTTRPAAFDNWFLAAYPDVARWAMYNLESKMQDPFFGGIFNKEEYTIDRNTGKFNFKVLRLIIDYYKSKIRRLECSYYH